MKFEAFQGYFWEIECDGLKGFSEEICSRDLIAGRKKSLNLEEGCPHPVEMLTILSLIWCNLAIRHGARLRSGKGCCQVKPNSGATKAWCGLGGSGGPPLRKCLKTETEKLDPVALVRPSRELRPGKAPAESENFLRCSRHGSRLRSGKGACQMKPNSGAMKAWWGSGGPLPEDLWKWELRNLLSWPLWDPAESIPTRSRWAFFSTIYPLKLFKSLNVKSEESSITRLTIFGRKKV